MLDRDTAVAQLRSAKLQRGSNTIWCTPDREPAEWAARNLCFGSKYILKQDMQNTYTIQVSDKAPYQVHVGGHLLALTVNVDGNKNERMREKEWADWSYKRAAMGMKGGAKGTSKRSNG
eukprot:474638-Pyramimonas_sp.AAC.1